MSNQQILKNKPLKIKYSVKRFNKLILFAGIVLVAVIAKVFLFFILGEKYLYDGSNILASILDGSRILDSSYMFVVNINRVIYFLFRFDNLYIWSIFYGIIGNICLFFISKRFLIKDNNYLFYIFYLATTFLLNIYVFNLSKDFYIFLFIYFLVLVFNSNKSFKFKHMFFILEFCFIGLFFKTYYFLILLFSLGFFILFVIFKKRNINRYTFIKIFLSFLMLLLLFYILTYYLLPSYYGNLAEARSLVNIGREGSEDAKTLIANIFPESINPIYDYLNTILGTIRLMFPIELLFKGEVIYIAFAIFQFILDYFLYVLCKNFVKKKYMKFESATIILIFLVFAYLIVSGIFEPDFGSFLRHESSFIPLLILFFYFQDCSYKSINLTLIFDRNYRSEIN